jgi:hypothetical protein
MADSNPPANSADKRAQIIAAQALREAAAGPVNWRAARKRRPGPTWSTPSARRMGPPDKAATASPSPTGEPSGTKN